MQRLMSVLLVAVAACGDAGDSGGPYLPDASGALDAAASSDGAPAQQGLELEWADIPSLPGAISSTVTVMTVKFHVKKVEVLGDAGSIPETTGENVDLVWNIAASPPPISFPSAPPAIYSKVRINLDNGGASSPSVEIVGTTTANGSTEMFRVTSTQKLDLEITGYNVELGVAESERIPVVVGLDAAFAKVDWAAMRVANNERRLEDSDTQAMDAFFNDLEDVFTAP